MKRGDSVTTRAGRNVRVVLLVDRMALTYDERARAGERFEVFPVTSLVVTLPAVSA